MIGFVELEDYLMKIDQFSDIDAIATLDAIVTSAVMSYWLHRRLDRRR
ncbi:hypothetical protein [Burkholderia cepacia]|nr:hypothetical protein [Burkholderia cepacia]MDN7897877.1 hypothetical protein [Burkholderia cepacia]POM18442.1 hypothetical protein CSX04_06748 [Burkholderia cepacia]